MTAPEIIKILGGLSIEIVVSSRSSNYTCCVFIETTPPGGGPPPHKHLKEEEIFTVLEGSYEFYGDGAWTPMTVGMPVLSKRDTFHAFRNVGATDGRMMLTTNGGGIDDYFRAISGLQLPRDIEKLTEISDHYGYLYLPPQK
ncbi:cupin domain-containing protein [Silvibacterium acidisoli]|uniref:cupin domain-containing protein n=1 Tax=Acidobacteriaceae bacterium ZG23-2 TaxID=2883246 RepID=UPI00406CC5D3